MLDGELLKNEIWYKYIYHLQHVIRKGKSLSGYFHWRHAIILRSHCYKRCRLASTSTIQ
jgi:hypothetical protein